MTGTSDLIRGRDLPARPEMRDLEALAVQATTVVLALQLAPHRGDGHWVRDATAGRERPRSQPCPVVGGGLPERGAACFPDPPPFMIDGVERRGGVVVREAGGVTVRDRGALHLDREVTVVFVRVVDGVY